MTLHKSSTLSDISVSDIFSLRDISENIALSMHLKGIEHFARLGLFSGYEPSSLALSSILLADAFGILIQNDIAA